MRPPRTAVLLRVKLLHTRLSPCRYPSPAFVSQFSSSSVPTRCTMGGLPTMPRAFSGTRERLAAVVKCVNLYVCSRFSPSPARRSACQWCIALLFPRTEMHDSSTGTQRIPGDSKSAFALFFASQEFTQMQEHKRGWGGAGVSDCRRLLQNRAAFQQHQKAARGGESQQHGMFELCLTGSGCRACNLSVATPLPTAITAVGGGGSTMAAAAACPQSATVVQ